MKLNYIVWMLLAMQGIISVTTTGHAPSPSCCTKTSSNKVRVTEIVGYFLQEKTLCPIKAVRFVLRNGISICSDLEDAWTKHAIRVLNRTTDSKAGSTSLTQTYTDLLTKKWIDPTKSKSLPGTSRIIMTTPKRTSTTWTPTDLTTRTPATFTTTTRHSSLITEQSRTTTKLPLWTKSPSTTERLFKERKSSSTSHNNRAASLTTGNWKELNITPPTITKIHENTTSTGTMTDITLFTTYINHTSQMLRTSLKIELHNMKKSDSEGNRKQNAPVTSQNPEEKKKALEWTEHFCQRSEIQETQYCYF